MLILTNTPNKKTSVFTISLPGINFFLFTLQTDLLTCRSKPHPSNLELLKTDLSYSRPVIKLKHDSPLKVILVGERVAQQV